MLNVLLDCVKPFSSCCQNTNGEGRLCHVHFSDTSYIWRCFQRNNDGVAHGGPHSDRWQHRWNQFLFAPHLPTPVSAANGKWLKTAILLSNCHQSTTCGLRGHRRDWPAPLPTRPAGAAPNAPTWKGGKERPWNCCYWVPLYAKGSFHSPDARTRRRTLWDTLRTIFELLLRDIHTFCMWRIRAPRFCTLRLFMTSFSRTSMFVCYNFVCYALYLHIFVRYDFVSFDYSLTGLLCTLRALYLTILYPLAFVSYDFVSFNMQPYLYGAILYSLTFP